MDNHSEYAEHGGNGLHGEEWKGESSLCWRMPSRVARTARVRPSPTCRPWRQPKRSTTRPRFRRDVLKFVPQSTHCDIVVEVQPGKLTTIGGNLNDSVRTTSVTTDAQGRITQRDYFAVIRVTTDGGRSPSPVKSLADRVQAAPVTNTRMPSRSRIRNRLAPALLCALLQEVTAL